MDRQEYENIRRYLKGEKLQKDLTTTVYV